MKSVLGIDIGGSGIKGAIVDVESGKLTTDRYRLSTPEEARPGDVARTVLEIKNYFTWDGLIGAGFPAVIYNGVAASAANISKEWIDTDVDLILSQATACEVHTVNDADAAGIAEMAFGAGMDYQKGVTMMITLGTGIGTAIFVDGHLLPNTELGHLEIRGKDAERRASDAVRKRKDLDWKDWAERLQEYFDVLENLLSPNVFIIGGGVSKNSEQFLPYIHTRARIVPAQMLNQAGLVGAALFAAGQAKE